MKKLLLLLALSTTASAQVTEEYCIGLSSLAETVMTKRQQNMPMLDMMSMSEEKTFRDMVLQAYEQHGYAAKPNQARAIAKFKNEWALKCYKLIK